MTYVTAASYDATAFIVVPIGRRAPFADAAPDTLLVITRDHPNDDVLATHIAEYVHEIGAMAVVA